MFLFYCIEKYIITHSYKKKITKKQKETIHIGTKRIHKPNTQTTKHKHGKRHTRKTNANNKKTKRTKKIHKIL